MTWLLVLGGLAWAGMWVWRRMNGPLPTGVSVTKSPFSDHFYRVHVEGCSDVEKLYVTRGTFLRPRARWAARRIRARTARTAGLR